MNTSLEQKSPTAFEDAIAKPEVKLLLCCSRTRLDDSIKKQINLLVEQDINWQYLISLASRHSVVPLLFNSLNSTCPETVPPKILNNLRIYFQANAQHNLFLTSQLLKILNVFQENRINAVPIKGPVLAASTYGNLAYRQFCDLDLLVQKKDFTRAKEVLLSHKYHSHLTRSEQIFVSNHAFQTPFQHSSGKFSLDLHWGLAPRRPKFRSRFNCLWNNPISISIGGQSVTSFSQESTLLIQCINATKEPYKQSLKQICDINEIIQTYPNLSWDIVFDKAQQLGFTRLVLVGLYLTQKLYGTVLPEEVIENISSVPVIQKLAEESKQNLFLSTNKLEKNFATSYSVNRYNFQTTDPRDKLLFLFDKTITPHSEDRQFVSLPVFLYYLYYLIRPIRLIGNYKVLFRQSSRVDK